MKVGYIGLGAMGGALARRLALAHSLCVWDIHREAMTCLESLGARAAASAVALARRCEVILFCLPRSSDVYNLIFGDQGMAAGLVAGTVLVDQSSGDPGETIQMAQRLAHHGVILIAAPVSGGPNGADAGTVAIMASGDSAAYERVLPLLHSISPNVEYCGERAGDAHALKLVNNLMSSANRLATLEAAAMGRKAGLSLATIIDILSTGPAANGTSTGMLPAIALGQPAMGAMAMALMLKDLNLAMGLAMQLGVPMPISSVVRSYHQAGVNMKGDSAQLAEIIGVVESMAGVRLKDSPIATENGAHGEPAGEAQIERLLIAAVAASNYLVTYECAAFAVRYGIRLDVMRRVIAKSGGWSGDAEKILSLLSSGAKTPGARISQVVRDLQLATELGARCGAPMFIANVVRSLVEAGTQELGAAASFRGMSKLFERWAGVRFEGA